MISSESIVGQALSSSPNFPWYSGSLLRDINDYFFTDGLRLVHDGVLDGMDESLRRQAKPYFRDMPPAFAPRLWRELGRATNIAWTTYVDDVNSGGVRVDKLQPVEMEERRRVALTGGRIMGMLTAIDATVNASSPDRNVDAVSGLYETIGGFLPGGYASPMFIFDERLAAEPQVAALRLGGFVHTSLLASGDIAASRAVGANVRDFGLAVKEQLTSKYDHARPDKLRNRLVAVAATLGTTTAKIVTHHTQFGRDLRSGEVEGPVPGEALGEVGGYWRQSKDIPGAFDTGRLTYGAAIILKHGGPSSKALQEIIDVRDYHIDNATGRGRAAWEPDNELQAGRFNMALELLKIKEGGLARRGSRRQIERSMWSYLSRSMV